MHTTHSGSGTEHLGTRGTWFVRVDARPVTQLCQNTDGRKMTGCIIMINQNSRRILSMSQNGRQHLHLRSQQKFWTERRQTCDEFSTIPQTALANWATQSQKPLSSPCFAFVLMPVIASARACQRGVKPHTTLLSYHHGLLGLESWTWTQVILQSFFANVD